MSELDEETVVFQVNPTDSRDDASMSRFHSFGEARWHEAGRGTGNQDVRGNCLIQFQKEFLLQRNVLGNTFLNVIDALAEQFIQSTDRLHRLDALENLLDALTVEQIELGELVELLTDSEHGRIEGRWNSIEEKHLVFRSSEDHTPATADDAGSKDY